MSNSINQTNPQIVASSWYNVGVILGIVIYRNEIGEFYASIGPGLGTNEREDLDYVVQRGDKRFPIKSAIIAVEEHGTIVDQKLYQELKNFLNPVITKEEIAREAQLLGLVLTPEQVTLVTKEYVGEYQKEPSMHKRLLLQNALETLIKT